MKPIFKDRIDAGQHLAAELVHKHYKEPRVLALPRGGVPVAYEVAQALGAPLDVCVVRKLGFPHQPEFAMGAIAEGVTILDHDLVRMMNVSEHAVDAVVAAERSELQRREHAYRPGLPPLDVKDKTVIIVDDGLATGATMRAAIAAVKNQGPAHVVVAAPVGAPDTCQALRAEADEVICLATPDPFSAVGLWYASFPQTSDDEVHRLLAAAKGNANSPD